MNLRELFENRSGRVIALFRAILVLVFLGALLIEPVTIQSSLDRGKALLTAYLLFSLAAVPVAWKSWWYDQQLAPGLLALDVLVFIGAVFVTESANADFTSPFLALFALAILSATLRWDWRVAAKTGVAVIALFLLAGVVSVGLDLPIDLYRFGRRALYMMALLLVLVWFGVQRRDPYVRPLDLTGKDGQSRADNPADLRALALDYAMAVTGAGRGVLAWSDAEEPWLDLNEAGQGQRSVRRLGPEAIHGWDDGADEVRLFDVRRQRKLVRDRENLPRARMLRTPMGLATHCDITEGLTIPLQCVSGAGLIVLSDIPGPGADFVALGATLARELCSALDRTAVLQLEREALLSRTRGAIARDLHDSVAQSLAGACFRLEALRRSRNHLAPMDDEIVAIRDALRREQDHVRTLIDTLRSPAAAPQPRALEADLQATATDAAMHWNVTVTLDADNAADVPGWYSHELQQLLREAVANAARHGAARLVSVRLRRNGPVISLNIADDGRGFDVAARATQPWSIRERVAALGGELRVDSSTDGTRLSMTLPARHPGADQ